MKRGIEDDRVERCGVKRQRIKLGGDTGERKRILRECAQAIALIPKNIECDYAMPAQSETPGHPAVSRADVENTKRTSGFTFHVAENSVFEVLKTARANAPLRRVLSAQVAIRESAIVFRVSRPTPLGVADFRVVRQKAIA